MNQSREFLLFYCRVLVNNARAQRRNGHHAFAAMLLNWAADGRREAMAATVQRDLFA